MASCSNQRPPLPIRALASDSAPDNDFFRDDYLAREACCHLGTWRTCENSYFVVTALDCGIGTVLDGLTIVGSYFQVLHGKYLNYSTGAGVLSEMSSLTVANCAFRANFSTNIYADHGSTLTLLDSSFYDNRPGSSAAAYSSDLNAIRCRFFDHARVLTMWSGNGILRDCTFTGDTNAQIAGNATVDSCVFQNGHGLHLSDGRSTVTNCLFIGNDGHLGIEHGSAVVDNCLFVGSTLGTAGGGGGSALFRNCAFINNSPWRWAINWSFGNLYVLNCTILGNGANLMQGGGGINLYEASAQVLNSIIWGNGGGLYQTREQDQLGVRPDFGATLEIDYSIVEGWSGVFGGDGNFGDDPLLADPDGPDGIPGTEDDDVRLSPASPAINAGLSTSAYLTPSDLDGHARVLCDRVDIGAYEFGIGDYNCNQSVDLFDFSAWSSCMTGPGATSIPVGCEPFDFNADSAVDLLDVAGFQRAVTAR